jgi:hypothetical protein
VNICVREPRPAKAQQWCCACMPRDWRRAVFSLSRVLVCLMAGVLCVATVSGCAGPGAVDGARSPAITVEPVLSAGQVSLPLQRYELTLDQEITAARAVTLLVDRCLRSFRLPTPPGLFGHATEPAADVTESAVQWLSVVSAKENGFNPPPDSALREFDDVDVGAAGYSENRQVLQVVYGISVDGRGRLASYGGEQVPAGGCLGAATSAISANIDITAASGGASKRSHPDPGGAYYWLVWPGLPLRLEEQAVQRTEADPRALAVTSKWHACMARDGVNYASPLDAMSDPRWASATANSASLSKTRPIQYSVAVTDARCQEEVDFAGTRLALLTSYEEQLMTAEAQQLRGYTHAVTQLMGNVNMILEGRMR